MSQFYDLASLVVIPSGYKASTIYAQKPLTTDGQLSFSRASTATRVNASGLIEAVASNVPRLDYLGSSCPRLNLEPQRTNVFPKSEDSSTWSLTNFTRTADAGVSPDGTQDADLLAATTSGAVTFTSDNTTITLTNGQPFVCSFFIKLGTSFTSNVGTNILDFRLGGTAVWTRPTIRLNLATGAVTNVTNASYLSSTSFGNGWYRITFGGVPTASGTAIPLQIPTGATMTAGGSFYIWGLQGENNASYATSYIPTPSTSAVTRVADGNLDFSAVVNNTSFTFFLEASFAFADQNFFDARVLTAGGNYLGFYNGFISIYNLGSGTTVFGSSLAANTNHKVLFKYDGANAKFYRNGTLLLSVAATSVGTFVDGLIYNGDQEGLKIKQFLYFPTALTDAQCVELTTL
jgi:hypothetical protein